LVDDNYFYRVDPDKVKMMNFYVKRNEAELEDDFMQLGQQKNLEFFQISNVREYDDNWFEGEYNIAIYVRMDKNYDIYER